MGLFDFISDYFKGTDLTRDWVERPAVSLEFDLDKCSLGGVPNGSRFEQFSWLGPADKRFKYRDGRQAFVWFSKGLEFDVEGGSFCLSMLSFYLHGTGEVGPFPGRYYPFPGTFILNGRKFRIEPASTDAEVVEVMGDPTRRTADEEDIIESLFYRIGQYEYEFTFSLEGKLEDMCCVEAEPDGFKD